MKDFTVSSVLYLLSECFPNLTADEAEGVAEHLMDYVADCEAKAMPTPTIDVPWINERHLDLQ